MILQSAWLLLLFLTATVNADGHTNGTMGCPHGWHGTDHICYRESSDRHGFAEAAHYCLDDHFHHGAMHGIMPVGKLRHFINRFAHGHQMQMQMDHHHLHHLFHDAHGPFRVNAIKGEDGKWHEYPSGMEVSFHHFPDFDTESGHDGDTLIWMPESNQLRVVDNRREFHTLCYRNMPGMARCHGYENGDRECFDAGDCDGGYCWCDDTFSGPWCEVAMSDKILVALGGLYSADTNDTAKTVALYDIANNRTCYGPPLPVNYYGAFGEYFDGEAMFCGGFGGRYGYSEDCWGFDSNDQTWKPRQSFPTLIYLGKSTVLPGGKEMWVTGGIRGGYEHSPTHTGIFTEHNYWATGPVPPVSEKDHCMVTISDCEVAMIGGWENERLVWIFNFETEEWRMGPTFPGGEVEEATCEMVIDPVTFHPSVMIFGGWDYRIWKWDLVMDELNPIGYVSGYLRDARSAKISDSTILYTFGYSGPGDGMPVFSLTPSIGGGFVGWMNAQRSQPVFLAVPRDYIRCVSDFF